MATDNTGWRAEGIVKVYSGIQVLKGVSISLRPGEVIGLVGHNGAGKSTLLKCLSGAVTPEAGTISLDGEALTLTSPQDALHRGISTVYQELALLPNLTVTENIFLGEELTKGGTLDRRGMREVARDLTRQFNLEVDVDRRLGDYPVATRQLLEIAVATHRDAKYLLLDEPTTALESAQVEQFLALVRELSKDRGLGILLIDHKMSELYAVADRIVALVDGEVRIDADVASVSEEAIVEAITGEPATTVGADHQVTLDRDEPTSPPGDVVLKVENLRNKDLEDVSLTAHAGRVLGIYGLIGSGRTEFLRTLIGLGAVDSGSIELFGAPYTPKSPADAQRRGIAYLTEERKIDGIIPLRDSVSNAVLPVINRYSRYGLQLQPGRLRAAGNEYMDTMRVRGSRTAPVASLSGGNQQKVLLARVLAQHPKVLLLDEPTKGVDIGVKVEIHRMLRALAAEQGLTVIVVSSEEEEVLAVADDVVIFSDGYCSGETQHAAGLTDADLRKAAWSH
ncbi:ABC transporter ATP-binding protein [Tessaracoccus lapidicaptus]|uniref:ABC transporter ATP-binding protein n=1 Tax=Tessaracoccus lapidicaptus TaxID=1427523 RepID=A0A1C0AGV9_9ACTN|nr:sugar ABC transporter ATP-binding protein [Tessaracoccus lapidicaptus]OCL30949.1 ABC transporter ATP-binding protein [Tessaracoccus lapidicaptus]